MSSIASLFGPTAEEIVYDRNQQERLRQQAQLQQSLAGQETQAARDFYQSGYNIAMGVGKGLAGMFGYTDQMQDPRIAKSIAMRKVFSDLSAEDLNDPSKIAMISQLADEYDLPELKLWTADRERKLLEEESTRQKRINDANKLDWKNIKEYTTPDGRVFRGGMLGDQLYEFTQGGSPTLAEKNSVTYTPDKKITVRDVLRSQLGTVGTVLNARGYEKGLGELNQNEIKELNTRIASRANVLIAEQEAKGRTLEEYDAYEMVIDEFEEAGVLSKDKKFGLFNVSDYDPSKLISDQVEEQKEQQTSLDSLPDEISNIQFDETAGERPAFLEDGTVVIMNADGTIKTTTPIKLSKKEMQELGIYE